MPPPYKKFPNHDDLQPCPDCLHSPGYGARHSDHWCPTCDAVAFLNVEPLKPSNSPPGSLARAAIYAARYRAGLPIWNTADTADQPDPLLDPLLDHHTVRDFSTVPADDFDDEERPDYLTD